MTADLTFILDHDDKGNWRLWACRGTGKGCARNKHRAKGKHCGDCLTTDENETLADVQKRLARGDA
jgi:hypothetical protein